MKKNDRFCGLLPLHFEQNWGKIPLSYFFL